MEDLEGFIDWMRAQGTPTQHLDAHRHYAMELANHPSLSAALRAEEEAGSPAKRIANLRQTAARIAEFEAAGNPAVAGDVVPRDRPTLEVEAPPPARPAASPRSRELNPPRRGCECKDRQDIYIDNDFGAMASMIGGGVGIGTFLLVRFVGVLGALAIAFGLAGLGGLVTTMSICYRCYGCRRTVRDLDDDEKSDLRKGRALVALVTLALLAGSALSGFIWWSAVKSRIHDTPSRLDHSEQQPPAPEPQAEPSEQ